MNHSHDRPRVTYSTGARFAGGGIGTTAYHAVRGYWRHNRLRYLICGSHRTTEIPEDRIFSLGLVSRGWRKLAIYDSSKHVDYAYRIAYDYWAKRQLQPVELLHAWSGYNLVTLQRAREMGMVTILDRALGHPNYLNRLLKEEAEYWGTPYRASITAGRVSKEIAAADHILVPSEFVKHTFSEEGVSPRKLINIPFGVNVNRFVPSQSEQENAETFRVLFVGHVSIRKGVPYLLEAWRRLNWQNARLILAGRNTLPAKILSRYADLKGVEFLGFVENPVSLFQQSDVFVFPSLAEGSALVTYEALACGLPLITTFNSGSIIEDGEQGRLIPIRSASAIANHLEDLRSNPAALGEMRTAARRLAEEYSWDLYGDKLVETVSSLLKPHV